MLSTQPAYAAGETFTWTSGGANNLFVDSTVIISGSDVLPGNVTLRQVNAGSSNYQADVTKGACSFHIEVNVGTLPPANGGGGTFTPSKPVNCAGVNVGSINRAPAIVVAGNNGGNGAPPPGVTCPEGLTWDGAICSAAAAADGTCPAGTAVDPASISPANKTGTCVPGGAGVEPDNCPIAKDTDFRWAYCPVFNGLGLLTSTLDAFINQYLTVGNSMFQGAQEANYKKAWETFRNFGIALVIAAGLIMLASEALNLSIVDAYTVRKVLPRLFVAIIGISVSWELCKFLIGFFDDLGQAMGSIIYTSFGIGDEGISVASLLLTNFIAAGAIGAGALLLGGVGILSMLGTLILAMLVGAVILILRQVIIVAAVLLAPLAIAAYVLPNTSKLAHFWWENLIKMLMLYPAATGIIALFKVFGQIALKNPGGPDANSALGNLIATGTGVICFIAGYALLGTLPRVLGGVFATVSGIANDKSRGAFDRLKKGRGERMANNVARMGSGERFKGNNALSAGFNRFSKGATTFSKSRYKGQFLTNKTARATAMAERDEMLAQQHMKTEAGMGNMFNDDSLRAQASGRTEAESRANLKKIYGMEGEKADAAIAMAKANGGFSSVRQLSATKALAATGTGYDDLAQMTKQIGVTANGNEGQIQTMVGAMRGAASKSGRFDLGAAGHGTVAKLASESMANGNAGASDANIRGALVEAARSTSNNALLQGKPKGTAQMANALTVSLQDARNRSENTNLSASERMSARGEAAELVAKITNMQGAAQFGTEVNLAAMSAGKTSVAGGEILEGAVHFGNQAVKQNVQVVQTVAREKATKIEFDNDGKEVEVPNPKYMPNKHTIDTYAGQSQTARFDRSDPRFEAQNQDQDDHAA